MLVYGRMLKQFYLILDFIFKKTKTLKNKKISHGREIPSENSEALKYKNETMHYAPCNQIINISGSELFATIKMLKTIWFACATRFSIKFLCSL